MAEEPLKRVCGNKHILRGNREIAWIMTDDCCAIDVVSRALNTLSRRRVLSRILWYTCGQ